MRDLMRGTAPRTNDRQVSNYFTAGGEPLGERKHWLEDDYVKFMRFAQWQIEQAGVGVIGFVTNHGYLDNTTFRGMRHAMLETFDEVNVLDLHGNRKKRKATVTSDIDEIGPSGTEDMELPDPGFDGGAETDQPEK